MVKVIGVRFKTAGKVYYFDPGELELEIGAHVIVETARGMEFGTVSTRTISLRRSKELSEWPARRITDSIRKMSRKRKRRWRSARKKSISMDL